MKKIWITLLAFCLLTLAQSSFGQTNPNPNPTPSDKMSFDDTFYFESSGGVTYNDETNEAQFLGDVSFKSTKFEFSGAEKVVFNETTNKMTVYGWKEFTIVGGKAIFKGFKGGIFEYTIGDDLVYLY